MYMYLEPGWEFVLKLEFNRTQPSSNTEKTKIQHIGILYHGVFLLFLNITFEGCDMCTR